MAYEIPFNYIGVLPADIDFSSLQFTVVDVRAAQNTQGAGFGGAAVYPAVDGKEIIGVIQNNPVVGEACQIMKDGVSKAKAGGNFDIGDRLMVASGVLVKATATNKVVAKALESGASGAVVAVLLMNLGIEPA